MKTKKPLTDSYLKYTFPDEEFSANADMWIDNLHWAGWLLHEENKRYVVPAIYTFYNEDRHPLYVGKSIQLDARIIQHLRAFEAGKQPWIKDVVYLGLTSAISLEEMDIMEVLEIQKKLPRYCSDFRHDTKNYEPFISGRDGRPSYEIITNYEEEIFPFEIYLLCLYEGIEEDTSLQEMFPTFPFRLSASISPIKDFNYQAIFNDTIV